MQFPVLEARKLKHLIANQTFMNSQGFENLNYISLSFLSNQTEDKGESKMGITSDGESSAWGD